MKINNCTSINNAPSNISFGNKVKLSDLLMYTTGRALTSESYPTVYDRVYKNLLGPAINESICPQVMSKSVQDTFVQIPGFVKAKDTLIEWCEYHQGNADAVTKGLNAAIAYIKKNVTQCKSFANGKKFNIDGDSIDITLDIPKLVADSIKSSSRVPLPLNTISLVELKDGVLQVLPGSRSLKPEDAELVKKYMEQRKLQALDVTLAFINRLKELRK